MPTYTGTIVETLATLLVVGALAAGLLRGARRAGLGPANGGVELCGRLPLEGRRAIYLVKVGARVFVVGAGEAGLTKLGEIAAAELPAAPVAQRPSALFAHVIARTLARGHPAAASRPTRERD